MIDLKEKISSSEILRNAESLGMAYCWDMIE